MIKALNNIKTFPYQKHLVRARSLLFNGPFKLGLGALTLLILINYFSSQKSEKRKIFEKTSEMNFHNGRILNDREGAFYHGQERLLSKKAQAMIDTQKQLETRLADLEKKLNQPQDSNSQSPQPQGGGVNTPQGNPQLKLFPPSQEFRAEAINGQPPPAVVSTSGAATQINGTTAPKDQSKSKATATGTIKLGADMITFPVKVDKKTPGVVLPSGSYVKAKMLTGVDVPEGKTYPVLMVLDFSYVGPNEHKVDLKGCFMIAKAEGDLSTERVQMQATKLSCVSKNGKMFERTVNGFIADEKDGSFAMSGKIQSRQGRVASMAFLASIVEGVGRAVQMAQTTQQTMPLGGSQSAITGDTEKYLVAGGASNAAGMVAQWYLKQAQSLAPTVQVDSGRDVWIIMKEKVNLPEEFFKQERTKGDEDIYSYFGRSHE